MFIFVNGAFEIDPSYFTIGCIRKITDRDESPEKKLSKAQIGFLYHMYHPRSIYKDYRESKRHLSIIADTFAPQFVDWDHDKDEDFQVCIEWYKKHLGQTPLWDSVSALKEAIYRVNDVLRDPKSSVYELGKASKELDELPQRLEKMQKMADQSEVTVNKVKGEKDLKRSEIVENNKVASSSITDFKHRIPENYDPTREDLSLQVEEITK